MKNNTPLPDVVSLQIEAAMGKHEKECREDGPIAKLRDEVAYLKGWAKVLAVAVALIPLWIAIGGWAFTGYIDRSIQRTLKEQTVKVAFKP
jgi:hypothetical protein